MKIKIKNMKNFGSMKPNNFLTKIHVKCNISALNFKGRNRKLNKKKIEMQFLFVRRG